MTDTPAPCRFLGRNTFPCSAPHHRRPHWRLRYFVLGWWPHPFKRGESWRGLGAGRWVYTRHLTNRARNRRHKRHVVDGLFKRPGHRP